MAANHQERAVSCSSSEPVDLDGFLGFGPFGGQAREQRRIGLKRQRRHIVESEVTDVVGIIAGLEATPQHRSPQPDADRQLGRVMEVRCHEDRFPDLDFESRLFEEFPGGRLPDVLAVVHVSGRYGPQSGLRGPGTAPDHEDPTGFILDQRGNTDSRVPEVDVPAGGAHGSLPVAYLSPLERGGAHGAEDELSGPMLVHGGQRTFPVRHVRSRPGRGIMPVMQRSPLVIAVTVVLAAVAWSLVLAFGSGPLADAPAALLAADQAIIGTVIGVGMVLSRGRWTRRAALVLLGGQAVLGVFFKADGWWIGAVLMTAAGIAAVTGPWLGGWLRKLPRADGPPPRAVVMNLALLGLPALVAVTAPQYVPPAGWLLSGFALAIAWGYSRAWLPAIWVIRLALPVLGIGAAAFLTWPAALVLGSGVAALTALAWSPDVRRATLSPTALPVQLVPIPPELAPQEVLEAAGLDDRGKPTSRGKP